MIERINCSDTAMMTKPSEQGAMAKLMVAAARMTRDEHCRPLRSLQGLCLISM